MSSKVTVPVSMDTKNDRDLLEWLGKQENRSAAVRDVLRAHVQGQVVTVGDVLQAVEDLRRDIESRTIAAGSVVEAVESEGVDPLTAQAQSALDGLGF